MSSHDGRLAGLHVLVTRPGHQAQTLCVLIEREGGHAHAIPMLEIAGPADPDAAKKLMQRIDQFDVAIFVSPNAVDAAGNLSSAWPGRLRIAAVGRGTAEALGRRGIRVDIRPVADFRSEGLLADPALRQVGGLRILILRGEGGRELLGDALRARGAEVDYAEVYRRRLPDEASALLDRLIRAQSVDVVVSTSNEGLLNLYECAGEQHRAWLLSRRLAVIGDRTAALAATLGFEQPAAVADEASDQGLLRAIVKAAAESVSRTAP